MNTMPSNWTAAPDDMRRAADHLKNVAEIYHRLTPEVGKQGTTAEGIYARLQDAFVALLARESGLPE